MLVEGFVSTGNQYRNQIMFLFYAFSILKLHQEGMKLTPPSMPLATSASVVAACNLAGLATATDANVLEGARAVGLRRPEGEVKQKFRRISHFEVH